MDEVFERIKKFVERERWKYKFSLTRDTKLQNDLRIYGDDAVEFIVHFGKEFNLDVSNFRAADYFEGEGEEFLNEIIRFLTAQKKKNLKVLTLGHLEKAVFAGRLDEEVINS